MSWVVVKFTETDEVELLPYTWLVEVGGWALYPPYKRSRIEKAIKNQDLPDQSWQKYKIDLMTQQKFNTFALATSKATKACLMSDISDRESELPQKRIPKTVQLDDSSNEDSDSSLQGFPQVVKNTNKTNGNRLWKKTPSTKNIDQYSDQEKLQVTPSTPSSSVFHQSKFNSLSNAKKLDNEVEDNFKKEVLGYLVKLRKTLKDHEIQLKKIENAIELTTVKIDLVLNTIHKNSETTREQVDNNEDVPDIFQTLPLTNDDDIERAESDLQTDPSAYKLMVIKLKKLGGSNYPDFIKRILKKILTDEVMQMYSLSGHKGKKKFNTTKLFEALKEAVQAEFEKVSEKEIELKVSIYLSKAKERLSNKKKNDEPQAAVA